MAIQVIDRAVRILRVVARRGASSLTEISDEVGLPLPTTLRILKSLADNGIVRRLDDKSYMLGARLLPISMRLEPIRRSFEVAHPVIERLAQTTREDCGLAVLEGNEAVIADWCYGPQPPNIIEPYSREIPLYCAFGKVLIAFQPAQWRNRFLQSAKLRKMAAGTVSNHAMLRTEIDNIRRTGLHISTAENVDGAGSLSVPVFDPTSRLLGALFVTGPLNRLGKRQMERHRTLLFEAAERIATNLRDAQVRRGGRPRR